MIWARSVPNHEGETKHNGALRQGRRLGPSGDRYGLLSGTVAQYAMGEEAKRTGGLLRVPPHDAERIAVFRL